MPIPNGSGSLGSFLSITATRTATTATNCQYPCCSGGCGSDVFLSAAATNGQKHNGKTFVH